MMDRFVRLSIPPLCIATLVGAILIWPDRRPIRDGSNPDDLQNANQVEAPVVMHADPSLQPVRQRPSYPHPVLDESTTSIESIDLTEMLRESQQTASEQDATSDLADSRGADSRGADSGPHEIVDSSPGSSAAPGRHLEPIQESSDPDNSVQPPLVDRVNPDRQRPLETPLIPPAGFASSQSDPLSPHHIPASEGDQQSVVVERFPSNELQLPAGHDGRQALQPAIQPPSQHPIHSHTGAATSNVPLPSHVVERLEAQVERSATLARKGALFSARNEFVQTLYLIAEARDSMNGTRVSTLHLDAALTSLSESNDFSRDAQSQAYTVDVARIIARHETPILDNEVGNPITPLEAMRRYYEFAGIHFVRAFANEPVAAEALHALGKLHIMPGGLGERGESFALPKAVVFFQSAVIVDPTNAKSANELGVQLARLGEWGGAKQAFLQSVSTDPTAVAWRNLAVVHEHLSEWDLATMANHEALWLDQRGEGGPQADIASAAGPIDFVSPDQFQSRPPMGQPLGAGNGAFVPPSNPAPAPQTRGASRFSIWDRF